MIGRKSLRGWGRTGRFKQKEEVEEGEEEIKKKKMKKRIAKALATKCWISIGIFWDNCNLKWRNRNYFSEKQH